MYAGNTSNREQSLCPVEQEALHSTSPPSRPPPQLQTPSWAGRRDHEQCAPVEAPADFRPRRRSQRMPPRVRSPTKMETLGRERNMLSVTSSAIRLESDVDGKALFRCKQLPYQHKSRTLNTQNEGVDYSRGVVRALDYHRRRRQSVRMRWKGRLSAISDDVPFGDFGVDLSPASPLMSHPTPTTARP